MIALYKGKSLLSWIIKARTWSKYSHASWICADDSEYEAWIGKGFVHVPVWGLQHEPGTVIDLFDFVKPLTVAERKTIEDFLAAQEGKGYDYAGILGFVSIMRLLGCHNNDKSLFCFESIGLGCAAAQRPVSNKPAYKLSGDDFAGSLALKYIGTLVVPDGNQGAGKCCDRNRIEKKISQGC